MPTAIPESERLLPSPERLEILDYLIGTYLSELDDLLTDVKRELGPMTKRGVADPIG